MESWFRTLLPALLAAGTAWISVQVTVARLEEKMNAVQVVITEIRRDVLTDHEIRLRDLEERVRGFHYQKP